MDEQARRVRLYHLGHYDALVTLQAALRASLEVYGPSEMPGIMVALRMLDRAVSAAAEVIDKGEIQEDGNCKNRTGIAGRVTPPSPSMNTRG